MAAVLEALASSLGSMLMDMVKDEAGMLLGVSGEVEKMESKLRSIKDFLADAERRRITDEHVQGWVGKLKDVMYDATDVMDLCQLKAMKRQGSVPIGSDVGCCSRLLFCLQNPLFSHDIGRRIRELNQKLDDITKEAQAFSFINLASYEDRGRVATRPTTRKTAPGIDRFAVVGEKIEEDTRSLVEMLVDEKKTNARGSCSSTIKIIAIVGVGGIGKTTLAQMVFNNETIEDNFDKKIWLSINKDFDEAEVLRTAITAAGGDHHGNKEPSLLQPTLSAAVAGKRVFVVMDDVWSDRAWNCVLKIPLATAAGQGSSILITTRDTRVARGMNAVQPYHHVEKLRPEDAWCLLKHQVSSFERDEIAIEMLKNIGLEIIKRCDGLPLAIKAIGGLLRQREINEGEWEKVLINPSWSINEGIPEDVNNAIYLSYEDLTPPLRQCFMHISLFPKNFDGVPRLDIIDMWISEGFIHGSSNKLEVANEYYRELILRNLIEPVHRYIDQSKCTMHDVVRSFAHFVSRDEAVVFQKGQVGFGGLDSVKVRRLFIEMEGSEPNNLDWSVVQKQKSLRTLMFNGTITFKAHDSLSCFSRLRTLLIIGAKIDPLVDSLCHLKHLRYLSLVRTDISRVPDGIGKMKFLEYVTLEECEKTVQIPSSIIKLGQLTSFNLAYTKISGIPRGFGGLTNLESIDGFPCHMDRYGASPKQEDWCSLEELGTISRLRRIELEQLEHVSTRSSATKANLADKEHLTALKLACTSILDQDGLVKNQDAVSEEDKQRIEDVFGDLCPPPSLDELVIKGYFGRQLPRWMSSPASAAPLKGLRFLFLEDLACCTQLPDGLCQIPFLELIQIKRAPAIKHVGPTFVQAQHSHDHAAGGLVTFPRLHGLKFYDMFEWEEWEWEAQVDVQAMPLLEELVIWGCKLRRVPPGLTFHAKSLRKLWVSKVEHLKSLDSFTSVTDLEVDNNEDLVRIADLPRLQKLSIIDCQKLKVLEGVPSLNSLKLGDHYMDTLPEYLQQVNPRRLELDCSLDLLTSLALENTGVEWDRIIYIQQVKAYAMDGDRERGWYLVYKRDPNNIETNVSHSSQSEEGEDDTRS